MKGRLTSDPLGDVFHRWDVKLGFSNETSNETYLGLTDVDFLENPFRRYRSSALDQMNLMRFQAETSYTLQVDEDFDLNAAPMSVTRDTSQLLMCWQVVLSGKSLNSNHAVKLSVNEESSWAGQPSLHSRQPLAARHSAEHATEVHVLSAVHVRPGSQSGDDTHSTHSSPLRLGM